MATTDDHGPWLDLTEVKYMGRAWCLKDASEIGVSFDEDAAVPAQAFAAVRDRHSSVARILTSSGSCLVEVRFKSGSTFGGRVAGAVLSDLQSAGAVGPDTTQVFIDGSSSRLIPRGVLALWVLCDRDRASGFLNSIRQVDPAGSESGDWQTHEGVSVHSLKASHPEWRWLHAGALAPQGVSSISKPEALAVDANERILYICEAKMKKTNVREGLGQVAQYYAYALVNDAFVGLTPVILYASRVPGLESAIRGWLEWNERIGTVRWFLRGSGQEQDVRPLGA